ncbi:hypothetical protein [Sanyastnella coralliicola]|uniref:hypothetical protein n=1 Tax=Sanyastnella coralliicola TaxID=3069118 RepID=UPI0027B8C34F|nr:hypothetical protein [Longitalea sp. SCSIO 12813]
MKRFLLSAIISLISLASLGQRADITLDTTDIPLGGHVKALIRFYGEGEIPNINPWPIQGDSIHALDIVSKGSIDTSFQEAKYVIAQEVILTSFDTGYIAIPPIVFSLESGSIESNAALLYVEGMQLDQNAELKDIKEIVEVQYTIWDVLMEKWLAVLLIVLALVIAVVIYILSKRTKDKEFVPVIKKKPSLPAHIEANEALAELRAMDLITKGKVKEHHTILSDIIRNYLERRFAIACTEKTTREILLQLRTLGLPVDEQQRVKGILELADMVKFAKYKPIDAENSQSMSSAQQFVEQTAEVIQQ